MSLALTSPVSSSPLLYLSSIFLSSASSSRKNLRYWIDTSTSRLAPVQQSRVHGSCNQGELIGLLHERELSEVSKQLLTNS